MATVKLQGIHTPQKAIPAAELKPGMDHNFTFYSMKWAHESRIKELMELRNELFIACEAVRVENITILAAAYIAQWSGCTKEEAFRQVKGCKVHYSKIR